MVHLNSTYRLLRFGIFELNLDSDELRKDGIPLKLPPQPLKILALLASHSGQIVPREEIKKQIWRSETYVDREHGLNQLGPVLCAVENARNLNHARLDLIDDDVR